MNDFLKTPLSEVYDQDDPPPPDLVVEPKPAYEEDRDDLIAEPVKPRSPDTLEEKKSEQERWPDDYDYAEDFVSFDVMRDRP